ncbi:hypothetical protein EDD29_0639 [Actinocorallia herbida]|uniref:UPF0182 protein EDD29_0639 n=1 Tax=Actinocorallia herbida TaxID=58109 RepID=A0A3N1CP98_9ACTN|nr:UPF0182 family protein [Actinocorallia herbida]ROO83147.1 hypothetical protein EDD29_0639 [Actinocorallia herbida]
MSFRTPRPGGRRVPEGRPRLLAPVLITLAVLVALFFIITGFWTDLLWYRSLGDGFSGVFTTQLRTRALLFVLGGLLMAAAVGLNMVIAYRLRPAYRPVSVEQQGLERYRAAVDPHRKAVFFALLGAIGLFTGLSSAGQVGTWLAFMNRTSFGEKDAQFGMDVSFFVFTYPFLRLIMGFLFVLVVLSIIAAVAVHYLYGGLRLQGPGDKASPSARAHLSVLVGLFVLLKAIAYWLDRWGLAYSERGKVTGLGYTDVNAVLPAKTILAAIALICAILFFVNIWRRGMMLPGVGFGLLVLSAILIGGVYPLIIQQFQVKPNELAKERVYIERNIEATREAFGVGGVEEQNYAPTKQPDAEEAEKYSETIPNVRLLDPTLLSPTFRQNQQLQGYYTFSDPLDIDRYPDADGKMQDTLVAVRELTGPPGTQSGWVNEHLTYTHGYGFVAAPGNTVDPQSKGPVYTASDMPQSCEMKTKENECQFSIEKPQVYFGEQSPDYSIVGVQDELDFPNGPRTTYDGTGGVRMDSFFNRVSYALKFRDRNILLSGDITEQSRILYDRNPRERVQKAAPWLTVDGNAYPVVADGRIVWVVDGYTTSNGYPYSERINLQDTTRDSNSNRQAVGRQPGSEINYIRNSVKATVDAYDGTVTLYAWDESDPVLKTWQKAFPGTVKTKAELEKTLGGEVFSHVRYPEDLFKVQRSVLRSYHVTDPSAFYDGQDSWEIPVDPTEASVTEPPFYLTLQMPSREEEKEPEQPGFSLTSTYVSRNGTNLTGFLAANSDPGSPNFGELRLLQVPREVSILGPGQMQNTFKGNDKVAPVLNRPAGSTTQVVYGNLLTLPFGGGFMYVQPVYQQSASGAQYPVLGWVLVSFGDQIGFATTFEDALKQVLQPGTEVPTTGQTPEQPETAPGTSPSVQQAINAVKQAFQESQDALKSGDLKKYAEAQDKLSQAINNLVEVQNKADDTAPTSTPSPSPTN